MCSVMLMDGEELQVVKDVRARMPRGIVVPLNADYPIDNEEACLCGVDIKATIEANGLVASQNEWQWPFGDWEAKAQPELTLTHQVSVSWNSTKP